jgi:squalene-hopene/tetraprenyl-beta-curcumene cyclase
LNRHRLQAAYRQARHDLLEERVADKSHWEGCLSASALSTATAISALALVARSRRPGHAGDPHPTHAHLIDAGVQWLVRHQNHDGGWGDTDKSYSNISTTMLARAALVLSDTAAQFPETAERANSYIAEQGGVPGVRRRYGRDKTFAVPILANSALAGLVSWQDVAPLPFELACFPQSLYRFLRMPVVSYAIPALVAVGQARYHHLPPRNPFTRLVRRFSAQKSLRVLQQMQPESGGYLEAVPLTSFVVMSLASIGLPDHPISRQGVFFIEQSVRPDGSWPIDTNLATWNTTLSLNALAVAGEDVAGWASLEWLLNCQHRHVHPFTGADPGGWGWSDLSGAVPDADDTPGALLALAAWKRSPTIEASSRKKIFEAALLGVRWLLDLQNADGGWPTFCRGWGKLPFDRSGADLTAHALRALNVWQTEMHESACRTAIQRGLGYLQRTQRPDGSWVPLWFGNQNLPGEENPVYGTSKVLLAYADLGQRDSQAVHRGFAWLSASRNQDGGWGGGPAMSGQRGPECQSSVEETAVAVEAWYRAASGPVAQPAAEAGLEWLVAAVEGKRHQESSPIGFYFAKLWYYEKLYPTIFTVSALAAALQRTPAASEQG